MNKVSLLFLSVYFLMSCGQNSGEDLNTSENNSPDKDSLQYMTSEDTDENDLSAGSPSPKSYDFSKLNQSIDANDTAGFYEKTFGLYPFNQHSKSYLEDYHFYDLDQDGDLDLIYDGWSGGEPMMVEISMNVNGAFKKQFRDYIYLRDLFFDDNRKLDSLIIDDPGCCGTEVVKVRFYDINISKDKLKPTLRLEEVRHHSEEKPEKYFEKPFDFKVLNETYWMRVTPEIDTVNWFFPDYKGNKFIVFNKDDTGKALAKKTDSTGRIWWYSSLEYKGSDYYGWMSSRFLEKIE